MDELLTKSTTPDRASAENEFSLFSIIDVWFKKKWQVAGITAVGLFGAFLWVWIAPPVYESKAILFATTKEAFEDVFITGAIRDSIIERFDLNAHYDIEPARPDANRLLHKKLMDNMVIELNNHGKYVQIVVRDHDPAMAAAIANEMAQISNRICSRLYLEMKKNTEDNNGTQSFSEFGALLSAQTDIIERRQKIESLNTKIAVVKNQLKQRSLNENVDEMNAELVRSQKEINNLNDLGARLTQLSQNENEVKKLAQSDDRLLAFEMDRLKSQEELAQLERNFQRILLRLSPELWKNSDAISDDNPAELVAQLLKIEAQKTAPSAYMVIEKAKIDETAVWPNKSKILTAASFASFVTALSIIALLTFFNAEWRRYQNEKLAKSIENNS